MKLLSIQSDAISYDFEQAKLPGRTGWNDADVGEHDKLRPWVRGFTLHFAHDLWAGPVGYEPRASPRC